MALLNQIASKWQKEWNEKKVYESDPDFSRKKFYSTIAFPYPNSPFHLGHGRTYVTGDILSRYMRMKGYNTLLPMGFHYTGTPIIAMADQVQKGDKELISIFKDIYEIPSDVIPKLSDPLFMANYFKEEIKQAMKELGLAIDWRREFTTIDPEFSSFIVWQFTKLQEKGYIVRGTHPVGWCPVHNIPVGSHDTIGDMEPDIDEYVIIYFNSELGIFPAATLRPETIFGAVAIWVNPSINYVIAEVDGIKMVLAERGALKLTFQRDNVKVLEKIKGSHLVGKTVINPITGKEIPVLGASFVDEDTATGVVMSVPAHAPFDYYYLRKVKEDLPVIPVIKLEGYGEAPAKEIVDTNKPKNDEDLKKLTEIIYRQEFLKGVMRDDIISRVKPEYVEALKTIVGKKVPEAREMITKFLIENNLGSKMYEVMNRPIYCRCGNEIVVKILKDQWFLDYGNPEWKEKAKKLLSKMAIIPEDFRRDFEYSLEWLNKRACARTRGLGTPLPWDKKWVIESLSDSTIYMTYYTVSHKIKKYGLKPSQLTYEFWDYVILGNGDANKVSKETNIPVEILEDLRKEFLYWYPLDMRHSGKDLIPNHLSFFIFNHAAIFPEELWPRGIAINGFVLYEGKKMSKSLRNIVPLRKAIRLYSPDVVRLALTTNADMNSDVNFSDSYAKSLAEILKKFYDLSQSLDKYKGTQIGFAEKWLITVLNMYIRDITSHMDKLELRDAGNKLIYGFDSAIAEYFDMVKANNLEPNGDVLRRVLTAWAKMIQPFAPHIAEEIWHILGNSTLVVNEKWPNYAEEEIDNYVYLVHEYYNSLIEDIRNIMNVYKDKVNEIHIYVADSGQLSLLKEALIYLSEGKSLKQFMQDKRPKDAKLYQKLFNYATSLNGDLRKLILNYNIDEYSVLNENLNYLKYKLNVKEIQIHRYEDLDKNKYKKDSLPLKPAIILG
ncbi:MAG: leucine--tRNA ligase [Sulfolobaceae archaeon]|nr:leucine--tRNA ligase [Sulfolobaceae archaeon]